MAKSSNVNIGLDQLFQCRALSVPDDRKLLPILAAMELSHLGGMAEPGSWAEPQTGGSQHHLLPDFPDATAVKIHLAKQETQEMWVPSLGQEDLLE